MQRLGKNLADYLISEGLVRTPYTTGSEPVVFVEPTEGAPAPSDLKDTAETDISLTIQSSGGFGTNPYEGFLNRRTLALTFRCKPKKEKELIDFANSIDILLDDKRSFTMGDIHIDIAQLYRPLQNVPVSNPAEGSVYIADYYFLMRKSELTE